MATIHDVLNYIVDLWEAIPENSNKEEIENAIEEGFTKFKLNPIINPIGGFRECFDGFAKMEGINLKFTGYICREIGKKLEISYLIFLGQYILATYYMDIEYDPFASLDCFIQADNLWFDDLSEQYYFGNIALPYITLQEWDFAISYLERAIDIAMVYNDKKSLGMYYQNKGVAHRGKNELEQALRCYKIALKISEEINDQYLPIRKKNINEIKIDINFRDANVNTNKFIIEHSNGFPDRSFLRESDNFERILFVERDKKDCPLYKYQWILTESNKQYLIHSGIGNGAQGIVYHISEGEEAPPNYAMKILSPNKKFKFNSLQIDRFDREIKLLSEIRHPHIVPLIDKGLIYGQIKFYIMPYYKMNLKEVIDRVQYKYTTPKYLLGMINGIWSGICFLHELKIIHRDLKPENILIDNNSPIISDLGVAFIKTETTELLTRSNTQLGSFIYKAPEQRISPHLITEKADYYSFGLVLFELLTGSTFILIKEKRKLLSKSLESWPSSTGIKIVELIEQLTEENPRDRPEKNEINRALQIINSSINIE